MQTDLYSKYQLEPERLLRARGCLVGRPGAGHRSPGDDDRHRHRLDEPDRRPAAPADLASESSTSRFIPYYTMFAAPSGRGRRVRPAAAVRAVLARRPAHRAAGVHDGVERPRHLRPADGVRGVGAAAGGPADRLQPDRLRAVDRPADHAADRRRQPGAVRRPPADPRRRRAAVRAAVLRRRAAELRPGDDGDRRTATSSSSTTGGRRTASRWARRWAKLFPGFEGDLGDRVGLADEPDTGDEGDAAARRPRRPTGTPAELLAQAGQLFDEANAALAASDLDGYQTNIEAAEALVDQALALLEPPTDGG